MSGGCTVCSHAHIVAWHRTVRWVNMQCVGMDGCGKTSHCLAAQMVVVVVAVVVWSPMVWAPMVLAPTVNGGYSMPATVGC